MSSKPTVLIVHGSWHVPDHFKRQRAAFERAGYETSCPRQPSVGNLPPVGFSDDAQAITDELERLVESEDKDVVVVAHSYGGMVASEAVKRHFSKAERAKAGKAGGVVRIVYLTAFLVPVGSSLSTPLGGAIPPFIPVDNKKMCIMEDPKKRFFDDLAPAEQEKWAAAMLKSPASTQLAPLTHAAYMSHPVSYIYCMMDKALPLQAQEMMVNTISHQYGINIPTDSLLASHSPYLSMPDQVLDAVERQLAKGY